MNQKWTFVFCLVAALATSQACGNRDAPPPPTPPAQAGAIPGAAAAPVAVPTPTPVPTPVPGAAAAGLQLLIGQNNANFGVHALNGGFMPDPKPISVTSGAAQNNAVQVATLGLGNGCRGSATQQPDVIVNYTNPASMLRFFFQPETRGDTALVINAPNGTWSCNDDAVGLNPEVTFRSPAAGQYDIWVASYRAGENIRGTLKITELDSQRPTR